MAEKPISPKGVLRGHQIVGELLIPRHSSKWELYTLLLLLFFLKTAIVLVAVPKFSQSYPKIYQINHFPDEYDDIAMNILHGNGYRVYPDTGKTAIRLPGYIMTLAIIFYIFGKNLVAAQILNVSLSIATAYVVIRLSQKVVENSKGVLFAVLIYLFHPGTILAESRAGIETLFTFLITLFIFTLYQSMESNRCKNYFISGCVLGFASLVKSTPLLFPFFLCVFVLCTKHTNTTVNCILKNIVLMIFGMSLVLSPWVIRNYLISEKFVPTMTLMGALAQEGLYATQNLGTDKDEYELGWEASATRALLATEQGLSFKKNWHLYFYSSKDEIEFDRFLFKNVMQQYMERPSMLVKSVFLNFFGFWFRGRTSSANILNTALTLPFLLIVFAGIHAGLKHALNIFPMILFIGYFVLVHLPFFGLARYHVPLIPLLSILAIVPWFGKHNQTNPLCPGE